MAGRAKEQRNRIGGEKGGGAAKLSKGKARGRKDERNRQGAGKSRSRLFSIAKARGPAVRHLARGRDGVAWSQARFCEVLIKKTNNFSFFNLPTTKPKNMSPALEEARSI